MGLGVGDTSCCGWITSAISGAALPDDFAPFMKESTKPANAANLRTEMEKEGCQILSGGMGDWPASNEVWGWLVVVLSLSQ